LLSGYRPEFKDDWPLTELQTANLNRKQRTLIDAMDGIDFVSVDLFSESIINSRHKETIHSQSTEHEKSEVLLDLMVRQSQANYSKTIACLEQHNQYVVEIFRSLGGRI